MGVLDLVPFVGKSFNLFYPAVLLILILFNLLELNSKLLKLFKIQTFNENEIEQQRIQDGVKVLEEIEKNLITTKRVETRKVQAI